MSLTTVRLAGSTHDYPVYNSVTAADIILSVDPVRRTAWGALDANGKKRKLIAATTRLDILPWDGERAGGHEQGTAWPRTGLKYPDGTDIPEDVIPAAVERAHALLAGSIARVPSQAEEGTSSQAIESVRAGSVSVRYFRRSRQVRGQPLQDETAYALIRRWLSGAGATLRGVAYGTDGESAFTERFPFPSRY